MNKTASKRSLNARGTGCGTLAKETASKSRFGTTVGPNLTPKGLIPSRVEQSSALLAKTQSLNLWIEDFGDPTIVNLSGDLTSQTSGDALNGLVHIVTGECSRVIVDLRDVKWMTRAGLRGLIVAAKLAHVARGHMRIVVSDPHMTKQLNALSLRHLIRLDSSVGAARAALSGAPAPSNIARWAMSCTNANTLSGLSEREES